MANIVDAMVLELSIDNTKFRKSASESQDIIKRTKETVVKHGKEVEASTKRAQENVTKLTTSFLQLFAALSGSRSLEQFTKSLTASDTAVSNIAKNVGMSSQQLKNWQGVVESVGGSAEEASASIQKLSENITSVNLGQYNEQFGLAMGRLGVKWIGRQTNDVMLDIAAALKNYAGRYGNQQALLVAHQAGISDNLFNVLVQGRAKTEQYLRDQEKRNQLSKEEATSAQKRTEAFQKITSAAEGVGRVLLDKLTPALLQMADGFVNLLKAVTPVMQRFFQFADWLASRFGLGVGSAEASTGGSATSLSGATGGTPLFPGLRRNPAMRARGAESPRRGIFGHRGGGAAAFTGSGYGDVTDAQVQSMIREEAAKAGVDPNVMLGIYGGEGRGGYVGDKGTSFGPFQLHTGGGLGDAAIKAGINIRDPSTIRAQAAWVANYLKKGGSLSAFHGYRGPWGGSASGGDAPVAGSASGKRAFIAHHTAGGGTIAGVENTLRQRGLSITYIMDREGNIKYEGGGAGIEPTDLAKYAGTSAARLHLNNRNAIGMEIIAKNDADVNDKQKKAFVEFMAKNYPNLPIYGHGQVNPGHKEATEGLTVTNLVRAARAAGRHMPDYAHFRNFIEMSKGAPGTQQQSMINSHNRQVANTTTVGNVVVHTAATDASGIARDIRPALERTAFAFNGNFSLA